MCHGGELSGRREVAECGIFHTPFEWSPSRLGTHSEPTPRDRIEGARDVVANQALTISQSRMTS